MSKRVTTQTEIKDMAIAQQALKLAGMAYTVEQGNRLRITSGDCQNAVINLTTGSINGDTDYGHSESRFGLLRQHYAEAKFKAEAFKNGVTVHDRQVDKDGNVVLTCAVG